MAEQEQQYGAPRTNLVSRVSHSRPVVVLEDQAANAAQLHSITRTRKGAGLDAKVTLSCVCGWSFSADEADDYAYSRLKEQEAHHGKGGAL
jgi:hypothetical protein